MPNDDNNPNEKKIMNVDTNNYNNNYVDSHKVENSHSKTMGELDREQQILLKDNKQTIIDFIRDNKDSIRIEDLKIYEPIYKCYREKGHCRICNNISNIICKSCNNYNNHEEIWLCTNHWQQHTIEKHKIYS